MTNTPFLWATGIEDTFIPQARPGLRALDEYQLTQHYELWKRDLDRVAETGVKYLRWGVPWYRVQPARIEWDLLLLRHSCLRWFQTGLGFYECEDFGIWTQISHKFSGWQRAVYRVSYPYGSGTSRGDRQVCLDRMGFHEDGSL